MILEETVFPTIDKERTGAMIRMHMDMHGLTVEDVRNALNLGSVQSIYHWLKGISLPSVDNLYALSVLLDVSIDKLLCGNYDVLQLSHGQSQRRRIYFYMEQLAVA